MFSRRVKAYLAAFIETLGTFLAAIKGERDVDGEGDGSDEQDGELHVEDNVHGFGKIFVGV
jgi:hypothetical protein